MKGSRCHFSSSCLFIYLFSSSFFFFLSCFTLSQVVLLGKDFLNIPSWLPFFHHCRSVKQLWCKKNDDKFSSRTRAMIRSLGPLLRSQFIFALLQFLQAFSHPTTSQNRHV